MKILYYCQHVLGIGHFQRSLQICRACARRHQVTMISGGPEVDPGPEPFSILSLPGLMMDEEFSALRPCDPALNLDQVKEARRERLLEYFQRTAPDCLVLELYPFGRKAFRFELTPLLEAARRTPCRVFCSLRDILVEKQVGRLKHEQRAVDTLNTFFDALLVHADPAIVRLEQTFSLSDRISVGIHYTGFISPAPAADARNRIRKEAGLGEADRLIVASIGSGSVGAHLLEAAAAAVADLSDGPALYLRIFTGPYCRSAERLAREYGRGRSIVVERFAADFIDWLAAADLSISMAGYNTSMNVLAAGVPALMLPFDQNREQRLRVERLTVDHPVRLLERGDLAAPALAGLIRAQLQQPRYRSRVDLDGARRTRTLIETLERR